MERRINWLHFSDLHYGQNQQSILLPKLKKELFKDIEFLSKTIGKFDIIFFTGDLTFSGKKDEFDSLNILLEELWSLFRRLDCDPYLIAIPGNHDLCRPNPKDTTVKVLSSYSEDAETRADFWNDVQQGNEHHKIINDCFENFTTWYKNATFPKPTVIEGVIPGDISAVLSINNVNLKIIGLNTAFLEFRNGDYRGKLAVHPCQLQALASRDPLQWIEDSDLALLLTHHDNTWYHQESASYYNSEINAPGTFFNHLCGHLHEPSMRKYGQIGSHSRRIQLAPSLFGLEKINDVVSRIHGYIAGTYIFRDNEIVEKIYPRTSHSLHDCGGYRIAEDMGFDYNQKDHIQILHSRKDGEIINISDSNEPDEDDVYAEEKTGDETIKSRKSIFEPANKNETLLEKVPRATYSRFQEHTSIRLTEQRNFVNDITKDHYCWLISDWSLSMDEFIGSILDRINIDNQNNFIINLENVASDADLLEMFKEQSGMPLATFCDLVNILTNHLLVFNQIDERLYSRDTVYSGFIKVIESIIDFCPNTYIILISRRPPEERLSKNIVRLTALDGPQVKTYIENHPNADPNLLQPENLDQIINLTDGIPNRIDKVIKKLKYVSFQDLVEAEKNSSTEVVDLTTIPKPLQQTVRLFSESDDRLKQQSFKALKILTILTHGETYDNLKKFTPGEAISLDSVIELADFSFVDIIVKHKVFSQIGNTEGQEIRIFKVPRHIRDIISLHITENERSTILKNACDLYFGDRWREGSIKNIHYSALKGKKYLNIENIELVVKGLLEEAIRIGDEFEVERSANLAVNYIEHIFTLNDYKNAVSCSEEIHHLIESSNLTSLKSRIILILGRAIRMTNSDSKAIQVLKQALDSYGSSYSKDERHIILIDLAYAYQTLEKKEEAIDCAKQVEKSAPSNSVAILQAKYTIANLTLEGDSLLSKLRILERQARKINSKIVANNISIKIAETFSDHADKEKRYARIVKEGQDEYNVIRALVTKTLNIMKEGNGIVSDEDLALVNGCYEYLYGQRMPGLFDKCHEALWLICIKKQLYFGLLKLFRYSSFIWRISGKEQKERTYFNQLVTDYGAEIEKTPIMPQTELSVEYYKRRKLEIERLS
jgi:tetratricopeptide (TPR) repeat protein/predicted MPP superfamily phosphohydrolase